MSIKKSKEETKASILIIEPLKSNLGKKSTKKNHA